MKIWPCISGTSTMKPVCRKVQSLATKSLMIPALHVVGRVNLRRPLNKDPEIPGLRLRDAARTVPCCRRPARSRVLVQKASPDAERKQWPVVLVPGRSACARVSRPRRRPPRACRRASTAARRSRFAARRVPSFGDPAVCCACTVSGTQKSAVTTTKSVGRVAIVASVMGRPAQRALSTCRTAPAAVRACASAGAPATGEFAPSAGSARPTR